VTDRSVTSALANFMPRGECGCIRRRTGCLQQSASSMAENATRIVVDWFLCASAFASSPVRQVSGGG